MELINGVAVFGSADAGAMEQILRCKSASEAVRFAALMGDNHKGYSAPIGSVLAIKGVISPSTIGYDIGCGIRATKTNLKMSDLLPIWPNERGAAIESIADAVFSRLAFGMGRTSGANVDHVLFDDPLWRDPRLARVKEKARQQLGTIGSGNHFVNVMFDAEGTIWIMAHFGSRGFGHGIASGALNAAANRPWEGKAPGESMDQGPTLIGMDTDLGQFYWEVMTLAGQYAYAGRDYVVSEVLDLLGADAVDTVHNHHNFAWVERHYGEDLLVHRKGATPAFPGQRGAVGSSMTGVSVILEGTDHPDAEPALHSTVHGAGRMHSRTWAKGKTKYLPRLPNVDQFEARRAAGEFAHLSALELEMRRTKAYKKYPEIVAEGAVSRAMMEEALNRASVVLRGADVDESEYAYKQLPEVLAAQGDTIRVLAELRPFIVCMAPNDCIDPWKD